MKKLQIIPFFISILFIFYSCEKEKKDAVNPEPKQIELDTKSREVVDNTNQFGFDLFQRINGYEEAGKNVFVSPVSVAVALAMTYNGADGETKTAMQETLKLAGLTAEEINESYKTLLDALLSLDEKVILNIANSIWYRDDFAVQQDFITLNQNYYDAEVSALDFADPASLDVINGWVAKQTNQKIKEIIKEISPDHVMFLINAIYFKGAWKYEFDEAKTSDMPFTLADGTTKQVKTMNQENNFYILYETDFSAIELPYGRGNYAMQIFLPKQDKTVDDIIARLTPENWNAWMANFIQAQGLELRLPKFRFEYEKNLNDVLSDMGMRVAFTRYQANFSKIANANLCIDYVKHKSFVEVNEKGTEAAAATVVAVGYTSMPSPGFYINRPFLFTIVEKSTNTILFIGKVMEPEFEEE